MNKPCFFCGSDDDVRGMTCFKCGRDPKRAAVLLLKRTNAIAETDILNGNTITGAHHRAIDKLLSELNTLP